ncbi:MAG: hypothetical protein NC898_03700 [Candidatus Omnitrophica bacterium]|nr:hypothetical protein [Candidatus Omnitrophota bacterium]MCM8793555.1 hypothetical protein [Candidatus Omnitrophota bacterium]
MMGIKSYNESTPNYSVISKARIRYGKEVFEEFFKKVLSLCMEEEALDFALKHLESEGLKIRLGNARYILKLSLQKQKRDTG